MAEWTSLFATKLRAYRAGHGRHGRMSQEELAHRLDVSVDAISKYERSLSYIRGDLEPRLTKALGWSAEDVLACREDWEASRARKLGPSYRLLNDREIVAEFGGSTPRINAAIACMETNDLSGLPEGHSASDDVWIDIMNAGMITGSYVMYGSDLVGHAALVFPGPALERRFGERRMDEGEFLPEFLKRPILPGEYFAYCPAVYIARGHEAAARLLLSGFVSILEDLAERDVFIREIGAISVNSLGRQLCEDLRLELLGEHSIHAGFHVWTFPGDKFASSILGRRSPKLRGAYGCHSKPD